MNSKYVFKIEVMLFPGNEYDNNRPYFWSKKDRLKRIDKELQSLKKSLGVE